MAYECAVIEQDWQVNPVCVEYVLDSNTSLLPPLTVAEANEIGLQVVYVLVFACCWRYIINLV